MSKVIDARQGGQPHQCAGTWQYTGLNAGEHEIYQCDGCHCRLIAAHVSAAHQCQPRACTSQARFTLDEDQAARWLERAIQQADGGSALDGEDYDTSLPDISAAWRPSQDGHSGTASELLHAAAASGILRCPAGWTIAYEYASDADGDGYRWLLLGSDENRPLILADAFTDTLPGGEGAEAALDLLREAISAGNDLLADLDRYTAEATLAGVPRRAGSGTTPAEEKSDG